ncbi:MAG: hypothetical protein JSW58_11455 [Candidatus Latescibacterota bacterium]|nr:MAG: hypothetical protein JSW58_11455 [Candidatus Latescibacterota bacterium]
MQILSHSIARARTATANSSAVVWIFGLALIVIVWSFGMAFGCSSEAAGEPQTDASGAEQVEPAEKETSDEEPEVESVTMSISLDEGGVIDLEAPPTDVKIERWQGDDVLVIVKRTRRGTPKGMAQKTAEPINIQVTRHGKNVRIETTGGAGWDQSGMDLSFRIVLPDRYHIEPGSTKPGDTVEQLTSVLWRAFHKEALKWLVR